VGAKTGCARPVLCAGVYPRRQQPARSRSAARGPATADGYFLGFR